MYKDSLAALLQSGSARTFLLSVEISRLGQTSFDRVSKPPAIRSTDSNLQ